HHDISSFFCRADLDLLVEISLVDAVEAGHRQLCTIERLPVVQLEMIVDLLNDDTLAADVTDNSMAVVHLQKERVFAVLFGSQDLTASIPISSRFQFQHTG